MPQLHEDPTQLNWAQEVYRALGWTFEEIEAAEALTDTPAAGSDPAADLARNLSSTERQVEAETVMARLQEIANSGVTTRALSELSLDLEEQGTHPDASPLGGLLDRMIAQAKKTLTGEQKLHDGLKGGDQAIEALKEAGARTDELLEKAASESKLGRHAAAQTTMTEVEAALRDMRDIRLAMQALQDQAEVSPEVARLIKTVEKGEDALRKAGFEGPADGLHGTCDKLASAQNPADDPAWKALLTEAKLAEDAAPKFRSLSARIETLCTSLNNEGLIATADELRDDLDDIRTRNRTVMGSLGLLVQLESRAAHKDKSAKRAEWTEAHLTERTESLRDALHAIVRVDADGNILTHKDDSRVEKRAREVPGLDHDVYIQIPRRADKKVPRATMEALLDSLTLLDELKATGVKGIEDVAAEELLRAEELLDGLKNHTGEYDQMTEGLNRLSDGVAELAKGDNKAFYIENRIRLEKDISKLKSGYLTMNISKAVRQLIELETRDFNPLKFDVEHCVELRKTFKKLNDKVDPLFDKIGKASKDMRQLDLLKLQLADSGLLGEKAPRYAGELSLQRDEAVRVAENATTQEELIRAYKQLSAVHSNAKRRLGDLKGFHENVNDLSEAEKAYFQQLDHDYRDGVKRVKQQKKDAAAFGAAMKPMAEELAAMLRAKENPKRLLDFSRGYERVDPETFDRSRLMELLAELNQLKKESAANHSHADNMDRLNAMKDSLNGIRGEITGFREDVAKELHRFAANCSARITQAGAFIRERCADVIAARQGDDQNVLERTALQQFLGSVASPLVLDGLDEQVRVIADKKAPLSERKAAREKALRLVRPLLAQLNDNAAIRHYINTPFDTLAQDLRIAQTELTQLELRLHQLAS